MKLFTYIYLVLCSAALCVAQGMPVASHSITVQNGKAGALLTQFTRVEAQTVSHLKVEGKLNACDFRVLRDSFPNLTVLDLSAASISMWFGRDGTDGAGVVMYMANAIPVRAFENKRTLRRVVLPTRLGTIGRWAFSGCGSLTELVCLTQKPPALQSEAINDTITAVYVPTSGYMKYRSDSRWGLCNILEGTPQTIAITLREPGTLGDLLHGELHPSSINNLTLVGEMDAEDLRMLRDMMPHLVSVDMREAKVAALPDYLFSQRYNLMHIDLPLQLGHVGARAFSGCRRLHGDLVLPPSVCSIGEGAFLDCERLARVVVTSDRLKEVGSNLFRGNVSKFSYQPQ